MADSLGESILYIKTDSKQYDSGIDGAKKGAEGLDKSFKKTGEGFLSVGAKIGQFYQGIVSIFRDVSKVVGDLVGKYNEQVAVETQLNAVLESTNHAAGLTASEIKNMASSLQDVTTFGDEAILKGQNLLLTFTQIGKEVFPDATEAMLNISQAMGGDIKSAAIQLGKVLNDPNGMAAMKRVGVSFTDAQIAMGKQLAETGHMAEYQQLILKELNTEFGGSARAARNTFGGALKALNNIFGDSQEVIGAYIAAVGRPFVENLIDMTKGVTEFLKSEEGLRQVTNLLAPLAGGFAVAWEMLTKFVDMGKKFVDQIASSLQEALGTIGGKGNEASVSFDLLGAAVKLISIGFAIAGKAIHLVIQVIADLINSIGKSFAILGKFGTAITDPFNKKKWDDVGTAVKAAGDSFLNLGKNYVDNYTDVVKTTIDQFKNFNTETKKNAKDLEGAYTNAVTTTITALNNLKNGLVETKETTKTANDETKTSNEETKTSYDELTKYIITTADIIRQATAESEEAATKATEEETQKRIDLYKNYAETIVSYTQPVFAALGDSIVQAIKGGENAWKSLADAAKNAVAKILDSLGQEAAARAAIALASFDIVGAALWGTAAIGAFTGAGIVRALDSGGVINPGESALVGERSPELVTAGRYPVTVTGSAATSRMLNGQYSDLTNDITAVELTKLYALVKQAIKDRKILIPRGALTD